MQKDITTKPMNKQTKQDNHKFIIAASGLSKSYGKIKRQILDKIDISVRKNESVLITGTSGVGKTTLLNILSMLEYQTNGSLFYSKTSYADLRQSFMLSNNFGFIFQFFNLIDDMTVRENIDLVKKYMSNKDGFEERKISLLDKVGLNGYQNRKIFELSGGEKQRVAVVRALIKSPTVLFADEPTGCLDEETSEKVMNLLLDCCRTKKNSLYRSLTRHLVQTYF
ncbi:ATP-binding cassette domain-containing protein [Chlamydiia bacterium]|nr:ATP-binding cassette domain-containing protein [Chlamydiia bacterium]